MDYSKIKCTAFLEFLNQSGLLVLETINVDLFPAWSFGSMPCRGDPLGPYMDHPVQRNQSSFKAHTSVLDLSEGGGVTFSGVSQPQSVYPPKK